MFKKALSLTLAGLLLSVITSVPVCAQSQAGNDPQHADRIKAKVTKLGTGKQARVQVILADNTTLEGYIGEIAEDHFTVIDPKRGAVTPVPYVKVQRIKSANHSAASALGFGAAVIGGVLLFVVLLTRRA